MPTHHLSKLFIASILLFSQLLTSCLSPSIGPDKQGLVPAAEKATTQASSLMAYPGKQEEKAQEIALQTLSQGEELLLSSKQHNNTANSQQRIATSKVLQVDNKSFTSLQPTISRQKPIDKEAVSLQNPLRKQPKKLVQSQALAKSRQAENNKPKPLTVIAQGGHEVSLVWNQDQLKAIVNEHLPVGFTRSLRLPVYGEPGLLNLVALAKHNATWHKDHIHVCFPEKTTHSQGYVYIGNLGLLGGSKMVRKGFKEEQVGKVQEALEAILGVSARCLRKGTVWGIFFVLKRTLL